MAIFLRANWENIIMANYVVSPEILRPYVPAGVELDTYENKVYVSLVGFMFKKTKILGVPIPIFGTFEEINLRFYVIRKEGSDFKRGVVFINETIPYKMVAWVANKLYNEHYTTIPTRHFWHEGVDVKTIDYQFKVHGAWNKISVEAKKASEPMKKGSLEEFIFEHYWGYTLKKEGITEEYAIQHPSWKVHPVIQSEIDCNFSKMYGSDFAFLNSKLPEAVFMAQGSKISVDWERKII
jgi:uncharacterized protein